MSARCQALSAAPTMHRADEMAARRLDAIVAAHREFARRRGIDLPN